MKALVYTGPEALAYQHVADPAPGQGEQLIRISRVGICGSDMHAYLGHDARRPAPLILGHEAAGVIVGGARDGERVTINPLVTCGKCNACTSGRDNLCAQRQIISMPPREGAFAEYVSMPEANLVSVPQGVSLAKAALAEPLACGWHAVRLGLLSLQHYRDTALVLGGGAIGLGAALALKAQGLENVTIIEPNEMRRRFLIERAGVNAIAAVPSDQQYDVVIDGVGYPATRAVASAHVRPGGVIAHIGLGSSEGGLDIRRMTLQEITFIGTYTYSSQDFRETAEAMFDGRLGRLDWTQERGLGEGAQAFIDIRAGAVAEPKILLAPETASE